MDGHVMSEQRQPIWRAAAASEKLTPDEPLWLAGYAARTTPARGTLWDLFVSALALEDAAGNKLVFASADIIAVPATIADAAANLVGKRYPEIPRASFVFAATHTHYGPEIRPDKALFFKIPPDYAAKIPAAAEQLTQALATAIIRALDDLTPVRLFTRRATATFAHNRRPHGDVFDHDVPILDIRNPDDSVKSILFGYACHNTTIDPHDCRYCADWSGYARQRLQQLYPNCTALFIPGCGADQNPDPRGTPELSQKYGEHLATAVHQSLAIPASEIQPKLQVAMESVNLEMQPVTQQWTHDALASDDPPRRTKAQHLADRLARGETLETSYRVPLQVARLGNELLMIFLPGEPVIDWSHNFKQTFSNVAPHIWVSGYCNDMFGYLPTLRVQREGGYEGGRANLWSWLPAPWTDSVEPTVTAAVERLVDQVQRD
jgi:neutral ceramidase